MEKHSKNILVPENFPFSWTDGPESRVPRSRDAQQDTDGQLTWAITLHVPEVEQQDRQLPVLTAALTSLGKSSRMVRASLPHPLLPSHTGQFSTAVVRKA